MKFAIVDGQKVTAEPNRRGHCLLCQDEVLPKCGRVKVWHWAHKARPPCDPWWENEMDWHRSWKNCFPVRNQEVVHFDPVTGQKHVADVKTDAGKVIELQNSPMAPAELEAREAFYGDMIWIVNGDKFRDRFFILDALPDPETDFADDIVFEPRTVEMRGHSFWCLSENPDHVPGRGMLVRMHSMRQIESEIDAHYVGHHLFDWKSPRHLWFNTSKPVYIDLCAKRRFLLRLEKYRVYDDYTLWCVRRISKRLIIESHGGREALPGNG